MAGLFAFVVSKASASPEAPLPGIFATKSAIVLDDDANGLTQAGDRIRYTVRITNTASTSFTNVYVIDQLAPGAMNILTGAMTTSQGSIQQLIDPGTGNSYLRADLGMMNGNSTITIVFDGRILASAASPINNTATVYQNAGVFIAQTNTTSTALDPGPDLRIYKRAESNLAFLNNKIKYTIVSSKGYEITSTGIVVTEIVPLNTTFVAAESSPGWSCADGSPAGTICQLNLGDTSGYFNNYSYFVARVTSAVTSSDNTITNVVRIGDNGFYGADPNYANNIYTVTTPLTKSNLKGMKSAVFVIDNYTQGSLDTGDVIGISIVVSNTGMETATNVGVWDSFGNSIMSVDSFSIVVSQGSAECRYYECIASFGDMAPGQIATMTFRLTATSPYYYFSDYANIANILQEGYYVTSTNQINLSLSPKIDLQISKNLFNCCSPIISGSVAYILDAYNTYNANYTATNVVITETIPNFAQFNPASSTPGWICIAYTCTYSLADPLPPNTHNQISFTVDLTNPLPSSVDTLINNAWIDTKSSIIQDRNPGNNFASLSTRVGIAPVLTATTFAKFAFDGNLDGKLSIGDIVTFTTVISNISNRDANDVQVSKYGDGVLSMDQSSYAVSQGSITDAWSNGFYASVGPILAGHQVTVTWRAQLTSSPSPDILQIFTNLSITDQRYRQSFISTPASLQVFVPSASLNLTTSKTAKFITDTLGNGTADVGDVIEYAIMVTNTGSATANDVKVIDCFQGSMAGCSYYLSYWTTLTENGYSVSQGTAALNTSYWQQNVTAQFGSLTPGDVATLTLRVIVTNALPTNATQIINQAQVYAFYYPDPVTVTNVVTIPVTPRIALSAHTSFYQRIITDDTEILVFSTHFSDDGNYTLPYQVGFTQSIPSGMKIYWPASSFYLACNGIECWFGMPWSSWAENNIAYIAFSRVLSETQNASLVTTTVHAFAYQSGTDEINYADNFSSAQAQLCAGPYEFNNTRGTANVIQAGEVQSQGFCYPYNWQLNDYNSFDEDWAVFTVTTPAKYQFGISTIDTGNWWLYSSLTLFAEDGTTVLDTVTTDWPNYNKVEFTKILFPGKYYVRVKKNGVFYGNSNQLYKLYVLLNQPMRHTFLPNTMRTNSLGW